MTGMIYIRRTSNHYGEVRSTKRLVFNDAKAMGRQIEWVLNEVRLDRGTPEESGTTLVKNTMSSLLMLRVANSMN